MQTSFRPSRTVLVIEDEDTLRLAVAAMLRKKGFGVIEAADGNAAVDLFRSRVEEIDLVLLDIMLPEKCGREVVDAILPIRPDVKVIITSAYGRERARNAIPALQPRGHLQKPYQLADLLCLVQKLLLDQGETVDERHGDSEKPVADTPFLPSICVVEPLSE